MGHSFEQKSKRFHAQVMIVIQPTSFKWFRTDFNLNEACIYSHNILRVDNPKNFKSGPNIGYTHM